MATERINITHDAGAVVYAIVVRLSDGKVFDWADNTWKVIGSTTTPGVALTSLVAFGADQAEYAGNLNLSTINATLAPVEVKVIFLKRLGGANLPETDTLLGETAVFEIANGEVDGGEGGQGFTVDATCNLTTINGVSMHFTAELKTQDGRSVLLATVDPAATCSIAVTMDADTTGGERFPLFTLDTIDCGVVNGGSQFEVQYANPAILPLGSNRGFKAKCLITSNGVVYQGDVKFNT